MYLLAIPVVVLCFGLIGMRTSLRSYLLIGGVAAVLCYLAYTR